MRKAKCGNCDNFICFCCDYGVCGIELSAHYPEVNYGELVRIIEGDCDEVPHRDGQAEFHCLGYAPLTADTVRV